MTIADTFRHLGLASPDPRTDGELVTRFVAGRDEPAFAELLRRHGPTVYGVCRRVVGHSADADDAFQAVFLVLARKANTIRPPGMVGNWLYGVAVRTANKVRVMNAKRRAREERAATARGRETPNPLSGGRDSPDELAVIDAELASLPDVYRAAFVTCELNGRSRSEASRELGWPEGTVAARLAKARELLAARLTKRGVTLGVGLFAAAVVPTATATEAMSAVRELLAVGTASAVAPAAQTLSDEVAKTMTTNPAKWLVLGGLVLALAGGGAVLLAAPGDKPIREQIKAPVPKEVEAEWKEGKPIELEDSGRITGVAVSADGKLLAITQDGKLTVLAANMRKKQYEAKYQEPATVTAVAFNPKGDTLAVTVKGGVSTCDAATGKGIESWVLKNADPHRTAWLTDADGAERLIASSGVSAVVRNKPGAAEGVLVFGCGAVQDKEFPLASLSGGRLITCLDEPEDESGKSLSIFPLEDKEKRVRLNGHTSRVTTVVAAADGKRVLSTDEKGTLIVWEGAKFEESRRIKLGEGVQQLALAPDGKAVAVVRAYSDTTLLGTSGRTLFNLELFVFDVTDPAARPKPLWSVRNQLSDGRTFTGPVSLAFAPDGKTLYTAFADPYIDVKAAEDEGKVVKAEKSMGVKVWELKAKSKE